MHASLWHFVGDTDDLLRKYDSFIAEIDESDMMFHACLATDDGILIIDTCPSKERYEGFIASDWLRDALDRSGLPKPEMRDHPVHTAFAAGRRVRPE